MQDLEGILRTLYFALKEVGSHYMISHRTVIRSNLHLTRVTLDAVLGMDCRGTRIEAGGEFGDYCSDQATGNSAMD